MIRDGFVGLYQGLFQRKGAYTGLSDPFSRNMAKYKKFPIGGFLLFFSSLLSLR